MPEPLKVVVDWTRLEYRDELWNTGFCLYAYLDAETDRILYIGKAEYQTVRQRTHGEHKAQLLEYLWRHHGVDELEAIHGDICVPDGRRRSSTLLSLVESLLIIRLQPPGNVACTRSRYYRPGLRVKCVGDWPHRRAGFHDWS